MRGHSLNNTVNYSTVSTSEIDLASGHSITAPIIVQSSPYRIEGVSRIIVRNKYGFLFTAEALSNSTQQCSVYRSELGALGPWEPAPRNPLWHDEPDGEVQNTSHADVFQDTEGQWWAVLSSTRPRKVGGKWTESVLGKSCIWS